MLWRGLIRYLLIGLIIAAKPLYAEEYPQIPAPEFQKRSFLNGMDIMFLPGGGERVPFVLMIKNGAAFDPSQKWGVTYLTTWAIREQQSTSEGVDVKSSLERLGIDLDFRVVWDAIYFFGSSPKENLVAGLNILADLLVNPQFNEAEFEGLRGRLRARVEEDTRRIQSRTEKVFLTGLFNPNAYEHSVLGTSETLEKITLIDLKIQHRRLFRPNQARLALYSGGESENIFAALSRRWGMWVQGEALEFTFRPVVPAKRAQIKLIQVSSQEGLLRWGVLGAERSSQDSYVLKVCEEYLTLSLPSWAEEVTASAQIQASVRAESRRMPGFLQLNIQSPVSQLPAYLRKLRDFLEELERGEIDLERLEEAKQLTFQEFLASLQDPVSRLYRLLETDLYSVGVNFVTHYGLRLNRITPEIFHRTLLKYLTWDRSLAVLAGETSALEAELGTLGEVENLP